MGLGSFPTVSLGQAREKTQEARKLLAAGIDPLEQRRNARAAQKAEQAKARTFAAAAETYIAAHAPGWRNVKHAAQWRAAINNHATLLLPMACSAIEAADILKVLQSLWTTKPETASRLRGRIETILSCAKVHGWRDGPNPAIWRGHLQLMLPSKRRVRPVVHYAALDWREARAFMVTLRERGGMSARALEFAILTAVRSGEVRGARWPAAPHPALATGSRAA